MDKTWIEIDLNKIRKNIFLLKSQVKNDSKFIAVVKGNAYGHGLLETAKAIENSCDYLGVYDFNDAIFLKRNSISKLLVLGPTFEDELSQAIENDIEIAISTLELLQTTQKITAVKKLKVQIFADTGLGRDGFIFDDLKQVIELVKNNKNIEVTGLYTHFSAADSKAFDDYSKKQIAQLLAWKKAFNEIGINPLVHASASGGDILDNFGEEFSATRCGISIYGLWPSDEMEERFKNKINLQGALTWKTIIAEIKNVKKGSGIGYNCTHILQRDSKIAILPVGYFDGIPRHASNKGQVLINGHKAPQLGRVMMNIIVVDITDIPNVKTMDEVVIIGESKNERITAEDWARFAGTINYDVVTRLNPAIKRVYM